LEFPSTCGMCTYLYIYSSVLPKHSPRFPHILDSVLVQL
jgi:hypothetical protein